MCLQEMNDTSVERLVQDNAQPKSTNTTNTENCKSS